MSFIILVVIFIMVLFSLARYNSIFSVFRAFIIIFGLTGVFFFYGLNSLAQADPFLFLGKELSRTSFYHLSSVWFGGDILVAILIIRNYMRYLKVNKKR